MYFNVCKENNINANISILNSKAKYTVKRNNVKCYTEILNKKVQKVHKFNSTNLAELFMGIMTCH